MGVGLLVGVWVARYLGVQDFGALNYAMAIVAITGVFATMGIESLVVKKLIEAPEFKNEILTTAFFIKFFGAIIGFLTAFLYCYFANESFTLPLILSIGTLFLAMDVVDYYNQSKINSKIIVILRSISFIITSALRIYAIINHFPVFYFAIIISLELFVSFILMYFSMKEIFLRFTNFSKPIAKEFIKKGFPLLFASFTVIVYMKIDQIILGKLKGNADLGIYSAAVKIAEMIYFIPSIVCVSYYPILLQNKKVSNELYMGSLGKFYFIMFWLSVISTFIIFFMSNFIIASLYGNQYLEAGNILQLYILSTVFVFMGGAITQYLLVEGLSKIFLYRTLLATFINILFNFYLINKIGLVGAVYSTFLTYFVGSFGIIFFKSTQYHTLFVLRSIFNFKTIF